MRKIVLLAAFGVCTMAIHAQKGKPVPKKAAGTAAANAPALTNADANNFIRYSNSVSNFLKSSYETKLFKDSYEVLATNISYKGKGSYNTALPQIDPSFFAEQYDDFNSTFRNNSNDDYVALDVPPAKMGAAKVAKFKEDWKQLQALHIDMANYYNSTVMVVFPKSLPKKKDGTEEQVALEQLKAKLVAIENKREEIYNQADELGEMAEAITLAKHPMKNEIIEIRSSMKIAKEICGLVQTDSRAAYTPNMAKVAALTGQLKQLQAKYATLSTRGKTNNETAVRYAFKEYYEANVMYFLDWVNEFERVHNDTTIQEEYRLGKIKSVYGNYNGLIGKYQSLVETNNR